MKPSCLLVPAALALLLGACSSHPNTGEIPPASELPTPFPSASTAAAPAAAASATTTPAPVAPQSGASSPTPAAAATVAATYRYNAKRGAKIFDVTCAACHQASGMGIPGAFPPLKGNPAVADADPTTHIQTILHGRHGVAIDGQDYSGVMPPFGGNFNDAQIADIVNYERSSWGNNAPKVTAAQVAKVRAAK